MTPAQALNKHRAEEITDEQLLRILVTYDSWCVPSQPEDDGHRMLVLQRDEGPVVEAFTTEEAYAEHMQQVSEQPFGWMTVSGEWLFSNLNDTLIALEINAPQGVRFTFKSKVFATLRNWSRSVLVERALVTQMDDAATFQLLCESTFLIVSTQPDVVPLQIALAPDSNGRTLAAIFTAPDALNLYLQAAQKSTNASLSTHSVSGKPLFSSLASMSIDGVVFNCFGPTKPLAVSHRFTTAFLDN